MLAMPLSTVMMMSGLPAACRRQGRRRRATGRSRFRNDWAPGSRQLRPCCAVRAYPPRRPWRRRSRSPRQSAGVCAHAMASASMPAACCMLVSWPGGISAPQASNVSLGWTTPRAAHRRASKGWMPAVSRACDAWKLARRYSGFGVTTSFSMLAGLPGSHASQRPHAAGWIATMRSDPGSTRFGRPAAGQGSKYWLCFQLPSPALRSQVARRCAALRWGQAGISSGSGWRRRHWLRGVI